MNETNKPLADWAIEKIESAYRNDVCLLIEHMTHKLEKDVDVTTFGFYIPATNRANGLAKTFIIDGIGHDLFPMSWERMEGMADIMDYNTTCLRDGKILWARNDEDRQRFVSLQARLKANLQNPPYMYERAAKWVDTAKGILHEMLLEKRLYKVRENAGHICDLLAIAVAYANLRYFKHGQTSQLLELSAMKKLPKDFIRLYRDIVEEASPDAQKQLCALLIHNTAEFLRMLQNPVTSKSPPDFSELANWYQELCYWWRRVYHWCDANDHINAYIWGCGLQGEVEEWGEKFGIADIDILSAYNAKDLTGFRKQAEKVEHSFRAAIEKNGVNLDEYKSIEQFLEAN